MSEAIIGRFEFEGGASMLCPKCGAEVHTADALIRGAIPNGIRFQGVRCSGCGQSYTIEIEETPRTK